MKPYDYEEDFHSKLRKETKKAKRKAQNTDRSKYKKTDSSKAKAEAVSKEPLFLGKVLSISGLGSLVEHEGKQYLCSLKGFLKKDKTRSKNLIAVGDNVQFEISSKDQGAIVHVETRSSILSRTDISGKKEQLIAVNVDIAVICVSITNPPLKPALIDRYLIAAEKGHLNPIIVINKIDLMEEATGGEQMLFEEFLKTYEPLGLPIICMSTKTGVGIEHLQQLLQDQTAVFSGQSGVGKSSILNKAFGLKLKTGDLTTKTSKGAHTTTKADLLKLPCGGYCVDTPGIRSFGLWDLKIEDVQHHFRDFTKRRKCKFADCSHTIEPNCGVIRAVDKGKISPLRYESYATLLEEAKTKIKKTTWG